MKLKHLFWKEEGMDFIDNPVGKSCTFSLTYKNFIIGYLSYNNGSWEFKYSEEYKRTRPISPIIDFPDIDKIYKQERLWPFFAARIPALNQPYQIKKIKKAKVDKDDAVGLLKVFGKETITNPFLLLPV